MSTEKLLKKILDELDDIEDLLAASLALAAATLAFALLGVVTLVPFSPLYIHGRLFRKTDEEKPNLINSEDEQRLLDMFRQVLSEKAFETPSTSPDDTSPVSEVASEAASEHSASRPESANEPLEPPN
ncbi:hypothetical protein AJ79_00737 [Helicocarpus griseus UAMH5409]|uniref:Uncharacterized protein n=1 Tax=Helicocarpus griseus UAMH5409 TaxID=1447875 RepID=A0A2B7YAI4_9EURO|nr:hypothetical protein AJ79_00737 [Helicocarpus griseus UAMH5409]